MSSESLIEIGRRLRKVLPRRIILHPDYFLVRHLCSTMERGETGYRTILVERLRRVLSEAVSHVPYYRNRSVTRRQVDNEDPFKLLHEFPFLTKTEIMENPEAFLSERAPKYLRYKTESSGSTGEGIVLWRTKRLADIERAFLDHEWSRWGWSLERSRILRMGLDSARAAHQGPVWRSQNRLMVSPFHLSDEDFPKIYDAAIDFRPEFIHGYPSCAVLLARFIYESGRDPLPVRALMLTSEHLPVDNIHSLQRAFPNAAISISYGLTERTNLAFATVQRGARSLEFKLNDAYGWQENRRDADGRFELVGTSYWNTVMPLIRYRTSDFGEIQGRTIVRLDGRDQEFLVSRSGEKIPGLVVNIEKQIWQYVSSYQAYQPCQGRIVLRVVPRPDCALDRLESIVNKEFEKWAGFFDSSMQVCEHIPRTKGGKHRPTVRDA